MGNGVENAPGGIQTGSRAWRFLFLNRRISNKEF